jgi:hypothetical protein
MSPARAAASVPDALGFARSAVRELVRGRWRIEKLRFDLDTEGRGEILYRLVGPGWTFHFFLVSTKLPEEQKLDRNWAQMWDAMGVLCQGDWTPGREALLRAEVPKQRSGYADYDTLVYARGNRSGRFFEHVVESLAAGRQPDAGLLARVGYILRTTAFIANGQLGTRAYEGLEPDHPFRRPYHAQMCSAWLLREYVFDLVDHMARARNPAAARLDPAYRRYLGLGNAAATGLVAFLTNHPHLMHQWNLAHETAVAEAKRSGGNREPLLEKAIRYYREGAELDSGHFKSAAVIAAELEQVRSGTASATDEAAEILNAIALELHPEVVDAARDAFHIEERFEVEPAMSVAELRAVVKNAYGWALSQAEQYYWWYRPRRTPRDVKRGIRGLAAELEWETATDTVLRVRQLWDSLSQLDHDWSVARMLSVKPELRHIVARAQSLAAMPYAELRVNWLSKAFSPFGPVRLILALKGLDKFESVMPKQVRGAFLQGAPIAEDVALGRDGTWPFPLKPTSLEGPAALAPLPPNGLGAVRRAPSAPVRVGVRIAPHDLARAIYTALQAQGAPLGVAEEAGRMAVFAHGCGEDAASVVLQAGKDCLASALLAAPAALDLACVEGSAPVPAKAPYLLQEVALRCAARGLVGCVAWEGRFAAAGPGRHGAWYAQGAIVPALSEVLPQLKPFNVSARPASAEESEDILDALLARGILAWDGAELAHRRATWQREGLGITMAQYRELEKAAAALYVPDEQEQRLRPNESTDALKVF